MNDKLTNEEVILLNSELDRRAKNPVIAFLLAIFMGILGIHRFYLGKTGTGVAMLLITLLTFGLGIFVTGIWAFVDLFLISGMIEDERRKLEAQIVPEIIARRA